MDEKTTPSAQLFDLQSAVVQVREAIGYLRQALDNLERAVDNLDDQGAAYSSAQALSAVSEAGAVRQASETVIQRAEAATEQAWRSSPAAESGHETHETWLGTAPAQEQRDAEGPAWSVAQEEQTAETTPLRTTEGEAAPAPEDPAVPSARPGLANDAAEERAAITYQERPDVSRDQGASAAEEAHKSTWGQWSAPPSLREGGWPSPVERGHGDMPPPASGGGASRVARLEGSEGVEEEEEDVREQVRRAVEQLRAELGGSAGESLADQPSDLMEPAEEDAPSALPAESTGPDFGAAADSSEDVREQVRKAVLEARAELESGRQGRDQAATVQLDPAAPPRMSRQVSADALDERFLQPASLVIDDPEGRVELVRVYRTLSLLECASRANLANYSSHSVTVQMEQGALPTDYAIADAIRQAFERECTVEVAANRATIRLAGSKMRAA